MTDEQINRVVIGLPRCENSDHHYGEFLCADCCMTFARRIAALAKAEAYQIAAAFVFEWLKARARAELGEGSPGVAAPPAAHPALLPADHPDRRLR